MLNVGVNTHNEDLVAKILLIPNINVDWIPPGYDTSTALYSAAEDLETNIPAMLLEKGAKPFVIFKSIEQTPVHVAVAALNFKMLQYIKDLSISIPLDHSNEESMDYQLTSAHMLSHDKQKMLADFLNYMHYSTEFQLEYIGVSGDATNE